MPQAESRRIVFIDVLRLIAAVQMIQGHTLDALLATELRRGPWFEAWTFTRGLTSTAFLTAAGLACVLAQDASARADAAIGRRRRLARALRLVLLGYLMHAPLGILLGQEARAALRDALAVDVLHCIGVSVALLELLPLLAPRRGARAVLACALGSLCFVVAGPLDALLPAPAGAWQALANYASARGGSLFPVLPFGGFVFWGMGVGLSVLPERGPPGARRGALSLAGFAGGLLLAAWLAGQLSSAKLLLSPAACALRLGLVLALAAGLVALLEGRVRLPPLLAALSAETLFLYVSHVLVLYAGGVGLSRLLGPRLGLGAALGWAALLLVAASAGALGYRRAARSLRRRAGGGTPSRPQPAHTPSS